MQTAKQLRALAKRLREAQPDRTVQIYWDDIQLAAAAAETLANRMDDSKGDAAAALKLAAHKLFDVLPSRPEYATAESALRELVYNGARN